MLDVFCQSCGCIYCNGCVPLLPGVTFDVVSHMCCGYGVWCPWEHAKTYMLKVDAVGVSIAVGVLFVAWGYP